MNSNSALSAPSRNAVLRRCTYLYSTTLRSPCQVPARRYNSVMLAPVLLWSPWFAVFGACGAQGNPCRNRSPGRVPGRRLRRRRQPAPPPATQPPPAPAAVATEERRPKRCSACLSIRARSSSTSYDAGRGQRYLSVRDSAAVRRCSWRITGRCSSRGATLFTKLRRHISSTSAGSTNDTMAFPPGVTIKDFQSDLSQGFPNPKPGGQPARFPTIIQIVPVPEK